MAASAGRVNPGESTGDPPRPAKGTAGGVGAPPARRIERVPAWP
jgi:hypothetical protein